MDEKISKIEDKIDNIDRYSSKLKEIVSILRSDKGCPWDKSQTIKSLSQYILEEVYEAYHAIETKDIENLKEELGDILSQIYMISKIAEEEGLFNIYEVYDGIINKLLRRHPHVFGEKKAYSSSEALEFWNQKKKEEKKNKDKEDKLDYLPTIILAMKLINKTGLIYKNDSKSLIDEFNFLSDELKKILNNFFENNKENKKENDNLNNKKEDKFKENLENIIGNLILNIINVSLLFNINPDFCLRKILKERFK